MTGILARITGPKPGKNLLIMVGVHGNETCGIQAVEELLPTLLIEHGQLTIVLGNPRAVEKGVRFTESNLNRMFQMDERLTSTERASYEYQRSRELWPLLTQADALLDIHSSGTKDTMPFAICEPNSFSVARELPVPLVSYNWSELEPGGTDVLVNESGGMGICIECGYHDDAEAVKRAKSAIMSFLESTGAITSSSPSGTPTAQRLVLLEFVHKAIVNFSPARYFKDFEEVTRGELIGTDGKEEVFAPDDGVVIFVRERKDAGQEAFLFGKETTWE